MKKKNSAPKKASLKGPKMAVIRFGGIFVFYEKAKRPTTQVVFPNSRPVENPVHDPRLTFLDRDRRATKIGKIHHQVVSGLDGEALICVNLLGEDELWRQHPRLVEVYPDGKKPAYPPQIDPSVQKLYDLRYSEIKSMRNPKSPYFSARIPLWGGSVTAFREVPGTWQIGNKKLQLMDGLEWCLPFKKSLNIRLVDSSKNAAESKKRTKTIKLAPKDESLLKVSFTSFATWYDEAHDPSFHILEHVTKPPKNGPTVDPKPGYMYPWPEKVGKTSPGIYCPTGRFHKGKGSP